MSLHESLLPCAVVSPHLRPHKAAARERRCSRPQHPSSFRVISNPTASTATDLPALRAARVATRTQFFGLGALAGTWGVHVPTARSHYALDEAGLALALLAMAAGSVLALLRAGAVVSRHGARRVVIVAGVVLCTLLSLLFSSTQYAVLLGLMLAFGTASALVDVAINTEAAALEELGGIKVMSGFHGMFSLGGMAAAFVGAALLKTEVSAQAHLLCIALAVGAAMVVGSAYMLPTHAQDASRHAGYAWPRGPLLVLGLLAAAGMLAEGAMYDWSVLYLNRELGAAQAVAALGYASFSGAMALFRFGGDALRARYSAARLLGASAALSSAAMASVLLLGQPWLALPGFALVGVGLANMVPILFIEATRVKGVAPAAGIASVSSLGYLGFLSGPPLVGAIAHASTLTWGLVVVVLATLVLAWGARQIGASGRAG